MPSNEDLIIGYKHERASFRRVGDAEGVAAVNDELTKLGVDVAALEAAEAAVEAAAEDDADDDGTETTTPGRRRKRSAGDQTGDGLETT